MTNYGYRTSRRHRPVLKWIRNCSQICRSCLHATLLVLTFAGLACLASFTFFERSPPVVHRKYGPIKVVTMTSLEDTAAATSLKLLRLVSVNVAGCVPSKEAPSNGDTTTAAEAMVKAVARSDPDILALQECPSNSGEDAAGQLAQALFPGYQVIGS